jgi:hypothetical protein
MPTLNVIAGPNGSRKSTLASSIWLEGNANLIDPDAIARHLNPAQPAQAAIPAAREAILRSKALLTRQASFVGNDSRRPRSNEYRSWGVLGIPSRDFTSFISNQFPALRPIRGRQ